jgi:carboxypeptidase Taq
MLSPAEELGLGGAALDARVRRAVNRIPESSLAHLARRLATDARLNDAIYERDGEVEPVRIMLRPLIVMPDQIAYLHRVCMRIVDALRRVPEIWANDAEVRQLLPFAPDEEAWVRDALPPVLRGVNVLYPRLDAVCDFTSARWQDSLRFLEPNLSGVGGIQLGPLADSLVMRDVVPAILNYDPGLVIERPRDQRDLFLQVLLDHAQAQGRAGRTLCLVEPKYIAEGPNEQSALAEYCKERHGVTVAHADPHELRVEGEEVRYEDLVVDIAYRDYEVRDLLELEREDGRPLEAMRLLFRQNRIVSSIGGEFDHKSCWELLTDERLASRYYTESERRLFRRHVLWTRHMRPRRTTLPEGEGDLPDFVRHHREELVLKPNRGYGGAGIVIGSLVTQAQWEASVEASLAANDDPHNSWVVQSVTNLPVHDFVVVDETGRAHGEPFYTVMGFAPTDNGLAMLCRVSQKQVVNVAQHGGLAAVLVGQQPRDLRVPMRAAVRREETVRRFRESADRLRDLDNVIGILDWDEETFLPPAGHAARGSQLATVEGMRHQLLIDDALGDLIEDMAGQSRDDATTLAETARLRRMRRIAVALPLELVGAWAEARSRCLAGWEAAREDDRYGPFLQPFEELLALARERAQALRRGPDLYDGLLDEFEPELRRADLDPLLRTLGQRLRELAPRLAERTTSRAGRLGAAVFADAAQERFCRALLADMGFDNGRGRVDRSIHPFTMMAGDEDVRITLRFREDQPWSAIFATLHEGGHALYDQGLPVALKGTLLADAPGMGLHESQALLWENQVGRGIGFWTHYLPKLRALFPAALDGVRPEDAFHTVNRVRPSLIRVDADEVTYNLHILLRYELETALLNGDLQAPELPSAWRERSSHWLGVAPMGLRDGCLQDVHWAHGQFGYFPSYTLGNLYAAQLIEAYLRSGGSLEEEISAGRLTPLRDWLARAVYAHGATLTTAAIMEQATGEQLGVDAFFRRLESRFAGAR